jgi:hypothetical protein
MDQGISQGLTAGTAALLITAGCCIVLYLLLISFFFPAVFINYSRQGTFAACFQFNEIIRLITTHLSDYAIAWVIASGAGLLVGLLVGAAGALLIWIPCLGQIAMWVLGAIAGAYVGAVFAHLFGQVGANLMLEVSQP